MFIRKWLHLHHSTSSLCFYSSASPCPLPIKSLSSALKASKISGLLLLRDSQDPLVSSCVPQLRTGTWKVEDAVLSCENDIKISQVCGNGHHNKHGLGYTTTPKVPKNQSSKHYRRYISDHHKIYFRHLCLLQSCPTAGSGSVDKMDQLCSARLFLGLFDGNAS